MTTGGQFKTVIVAALVALVWMAGEAGAAQCGNTAAGFEAWKRQFADEARGKGVSASTVAALMATNYSTATIAADRGQRSFRLSLDQFLAKRGGPAIVARARTLKQTHAALFGSIQQRYGVPPGPLLAIWGMETGFGANRGNHNVLSAVATLAYDCRRSAYFTEQLYAALTLIDRRILAADTRGAMHGEVGHTQFMPKSILNYGTGGSLDNAANALTSTANFLKGHGWRAGAGYQPGEANFAAIQAWNAAPVYQQAIALMGQQIDGGEGTSARR
jgi:membrane-bound lytic murein transglycosylase B